MNSLDASGVRPGDGRRVALVVGPMFVGLTLILTAQDILRRGGPISGGVFWRAFGLSALDWASWGMLAPIVLIAARRWRLDERARRWRHVGVWIVLGLGLCLVQGVVTGLVARPAGLIPNPPLTRLPFESFLRLWTISTLPLNLLAFLMTTGLVHATLYYRDMSARREREAELQAKLARAELNVLRMQLQPHFFFNALHTISSLMVTDVAAAQQVIASLGDILRTSIDHTATQEVTLGDELSFVERYVAIQKARFRQRLDVEIAVADEVLGVLVPSLVLQPLVENAIRHGIEPRASGGRISIHALRRDDSLMLTVRNTGATGSAPTSNGIGLANVEARLKQLYGERQTFRAAPTSEGFEVHISIPLHQAAS